MQNWDVIIIGAGASGMISAIIAAQNGKQVLLLEKLKSPGAKLKASGGGRCNLTNTLSMQEFISRFDRKGKFMIPALKEFGAEELKQFFSDLGVSTHAPDGYRVFPVSHDSDSVLSALKAKMETLTIKQIYDAKVERITIENDNQKVIHCKNSTYRATKLIIATGGKGYPNLGTEGDGYQFAKDLGHKIVKIFPAMLPLKTKETWVKKCRADTVGKTTIKINLPKLSKLKASGDLIFTADGIRGPVVLDFAREITPLLEKHDEIPILVNLTKGLNEEELRAKINTILSKQPQRPFVDNLSAFIARPLALELCKLANISESQIFTKLKGKNSEDLIKLLAWTPLTIVGHLGFKAAMITRGGVLLKEIKPETLESKIVPGVYFCGEVVDIDGPCGGFNLQWAFSSGYLAGRLK